MSSSESRSRPTVSVVVPAYRAEHTIRTMIESVLAQSFGDFELVICNDASPDETTSVVRSFDDPRIELIERRENGGEGVARDQAISEARGDWIAVLDADDAWVPDRLETLLAAADRECKGLVFDDILICHHGPRGMVPWRRLRGTSAFGGRGIGPREVTFEEFIRAERLLIKPLIPRKLIDLHGIRHSRRRFGADIEFFLRLMALGTTIRYVPEPMYLYRVTPGSATAVADGSHLMRECLEQALSYPGFSAAARAAIGAKVSALRLNEALYKLRDLLRGGRLLAAARTLIRTPGLLRLLLRRAARVAWYRLHRAWSLRP